MGCLEEAKRQHNSGATERQKGEHHGQEAQVLVALHLLKNIWKGLNIGTMVAASKIGWLDLVPHGKGVAIQGDCSSLFDAWGTLGGMGGLALPHGKAPH